MAAPDKNRRRRIKAAWLAHETHLVRVRPRNNIRKKRKKATKSAPSNDGAGSNRPSYMVLEYDFQDPDPAYSVLKVAGGAVPRRLIHLSAGMSFAAVTTQRGPRIVGVGVALTTVYDPKTAKEAMGPRLVYPKMHPVLIPHGGKLYALTRRPSVLQGRDFVPWFFVADFSPGTVRCGASTWNHLPPPPIFPCRINPLEYRDPPKICVESYAVVESYILLSVHVDTGTEAKQDKGTCAFDMDAKRWEMVDDKNLPFVGQAVHLGGRRFVACSRAKGVAVAVYDIDVLPPAENTSTTRRTELSIVELEVVSKGIVPGQFLCSLGKDSFASFDIRSLNPGPEAKPDIARIVHRTYSMVTADDDAETNSVVVVKQQRQIFKVRSQYTRLAHPSPVVAALSIMLSLGPPLYEME